MSILITVESIYNSRNYKGLVAQILLSDFLKISTIVEIIKA